MFSKAGKKLQNILYNKHFYIPQLGGGQPGNCPQPEIFRHVRLFGTAPNCNHFAPPRKYHMGAALLARQMR